MASQGLRYHDGEHVVAVVTYGMVEEDLLRISRQISDRSSGVDE
jgi:hypothetical protein